MLRDIQCDLHEETRKWHFSDNITVKETSNASLDGSDMEKLKGRVLHLPEEQRNMDKLDNT